jgi:protein-S-isoprenylcysteine O-methyltransferase Ste14
MLMGGPLLLGSALGLVIGLCTNVILIARIKGEERMLVKDLDGYIGYQKKVKYRLLPYIW